MPKFNTSDGLGISYVIDDYTDPWRQNDTLVMLHAAMGSARRFYAWVPHLARDFRVVRMELRGHGASDIPGPTQLTFERLTKDDEVKNPPAQAVKHPIQLFAKAYGIEP